VWAGVDSVWEQEKPEARKMLENAADSHTSGARFVGTLFDCKTHCLVKDTAGNLAGFLHTSQTFTTDKKHDLLKCWIIKKLCFDVKVLQKRQE
jgi:hypothetical protein